MEPTKPLSWTGLLVALWGVGGILALLVHALFRLTPLAIEPVVNDMMNAWHWTCYVVWAVMNAYMEGYRGFQKSFSPMVATRVMSLARDPQPLRVILAPFYCMALFSAPRKRMCLSWFIIAMVVCLIIIIRQLSQPWRGIVDVGVVIGLTWGASSVLYYFIQALRGKPLPTPRRS